MHHARIRLAAWFFFWVALCIATIGPAAAQVAQDSVNGAFAPNHSYVWSFASEVGWFFTPSSSFPLSAIQTKFGSTSTQTVTVELFAAPGGAINRANLLASGSFRPQADTFSGATFGSVTLMAGTQYFIGFRNVNGLLVNCTSDPRATNVGLIRYSNDDGSYSGIHASGDGVDPINFTPIIRLLGGSATADDLFICEFGNRSVASLNVTTGHLYEAFAAGATYINTDPAGVTFGPDGNLYVTLGGALQASRILKYDGTTGDFLEVFAEVGPEYDYMIAGTFGPDGKLYVGTDVGGVLRYNLDGSLSPAPGRTDQWFISPGSGGLAASRGFAWNAGKLYISDFQNNRILQFDAVNGQPLGEFVHDGRINWPHQLAFGPDGNLYVACAFANAVARINGTTGAFMDYFATGLNIPIGVAFGQDGDLYVCTNGGGGKVLRFKGTDGSLVGLVASLAGSPNYITFRPAPAPPPPPPPANQAPTADAGQEQTVECQGGATSVALDGSGSSDPDGDALTYSWSESGTEIATGLKPTVALAFGGHTIALTVTDTGGLTSSASVTVHIVDTAPPTITSVPSNMGVTATSSSGALVTFAPPTANDACAGSVPVTCSASPGSLFSLGTTTVHCSASDGDNFASASFLVTVTYSWSGVQQPVNADGTSVFKLGSTVPVKFQLSGASAGITDALARLSYAKITNSDPGAVNEATSTSAATTGNLFRYDAASQSYIFNWSTKGLTTGRYRLFIDLGDGVSRTVDLGLK